MRPRGLARLHSFSGRFPESVVFVWYCMVLVCFSRDSMGGGCNRSYSQILSYSFDLEVKKGYFGIDLDTFE